MTAAFKSETLNQIQLLLEGGTFTGVSDARLLERFVTRRDEAAFTALVTRHAPMVRNTCRAMLKDPSAADDAFQATFVLLFRKAGSIRVNDSLGGWLHRVAYRVALRAGASAARRRHVEKAAGALRVVEPPAVDDTSTVLHEEIERLAERFRQPIVLCDLEGLTREQAAERLGWTEGTLRGRLARGHNLLRNRLTRRGIGLGVLVTSPGAVPESLVAATVRAAAGGSSMAVSSLVAAVLRRGLATRFQAAAVLVLVAASAAALGFGTRKPDQEGAGQAERPPAQAATPPAKTSPPVDGPTIPVEGRILDLEGHPVAGATVSIKMVQSPSDGKLDAWIDEVKRFGRRPFGPHVFTKTGEPLVRSATTGPDGRFRIVGLPRDTIATTSITGQGIETSEVFILTRDMTTFRAMDPQREPSPADIYYGARFDHAAAPARPIVGTIRDKDTGAPIPGVHVKGMPNILRSVIPTPGVEATSDAQGRYQIDGLSPSRGFKLFTEAPTGQPYVNFAFVVPAGETRPGTITYDMTLKRGVLVRGRLTDKATGEPVQGIVQYYAFRDNAFLDEYPNFRRSSLSTLFRIQTSDGRFTLPALPGRGLIAARANEDRYLHGVGVESIKDPGFDKRLNCFGTEPSFCYTTDKDVFAEINPAPGTPEIELDLQVDPGRSVSGTILDPDGQPILEGVEIRSLDPYQSPRKPPRNSSTFTVTGLPPGPFRLDFFHRGRKLAGSLRAKGDETGSLSVTLQPWGGLTGRVVDGEGNPLSAVNIFSDSSVPPDPERGYLRSNPRVDAQGRFRIDGLVPGVKYDAYGNSFPKAYGPVLKGVQVGPGEIKDLGDIVLPPSK